MLLAQRLSIQVVEATEALQGLHDILQENTVDGIECINHDRELQAELVDLGIAFGEVKQIIGSH